MFVTNLWNNVTWIINTNWDGILIRYLGKTNINSFLKHVLSIYVVTVPRCWVIRQIHREQPTVNITNIHLYEYDVLMYSKVVSNVMFLKELWVTFVLFACFTSEMHYCTCDVYFGFARSCTKDFSMWKSWQRKHFVFSSSRFYVVLMGYRVQTQTKSRQRQSTVLHVENWSVRQGKIYA